MTSGAGVSSSVTLARALSYTCPCDTLYLLYISYVTPSTWGGFTGHSPRLSRIGWENCSSTPPPYPCVCQKLPPLQPLGVGSQKQGQRPGWLLCCSPALSLAPGTLWPPVVLWLNRGLTYICRDPSWIQAGPGTLPLPLWLKIGPNRAQAMMGSVGGLLGKGFDGG